MARNARRAAWEALVILAALALGCVPLRQRQESPPPDLRPTRIDYVDADAFDQLLESALVNEDPVILIQTTYAKPDWGPRLNAWIAAWNRGGRLSAADGRKARGLAPGFPQVVVDGDSIREFRLLIEGLMDRIEDRVKGGADWWEDVRVRNRRVALLLPYNLRFHLDEDGHIQLILFNGRYAPYHSQFVRSIAGPAADDGAGEWERTYHCSECKQHRKPAAGKLSFDDGTAGR
jgi:hypothetical protein